MEIVHPTSFELDHKGQVSNGAIFDMAAFGIGTRVSCVTKRCYNCIPITRVVFFSGPSIFTSRKYDSSIFRCLLRGSLLLESSSHSKSEKTYLHIVR